MERFQLHGSKQRSWVSSVSIVSTTDWIAGRLGFDLRQRQRVLPLASGSRKAMGPTQPPIQWVPGFLFPGLKRGRSVTLTTRPI